MLVISCRSIWRWRVSCPRFSTSYSSTQYTNRRLPQAKAPSRSPPRPPRRHQTTDISASTANPRQSRRVLEAIFLAPPQILHSEGNGRKATGDSPRPAAKRKASGRSTQASPRTSAVALPSAAFAPPSSVSTPRPTGTASAALPADTPPPPCQRSW